jgi:hypothetical protein
MALLWLVGKAAVADKDSVVLGEGLDKELESSELELAC